MAPGHLVAWGPGQVGDGDFAEASMPQCGRGAPAGSWTPTHSQKLEEQDRRALSIKEQLQREHRFLKRRLEQLSVQSLERVRTDSTGSAVSTDDSEQGGDAGTALPVLGHLLAVGPGWEAGGWRWQCGRVSVPSIVRAPCVWWQK